MKAATEAGARISAELAISIHAAREGGDSGRGIVEWDAVISIHAAREGGDRIRLRTWRCSQGISIHAAREGGDREGKPKTRKVNISIHAAREGGDCGNE